MLKRLLLSRATAVSLLTGFGLASAALADSTYLNESTMRLGADGTVYEGATDHNVYALDGATGSKKWSFSTLGYVVAAPALGADGTIYVGSCDHRLYALQGSTGSKLWAFQTGGEIVSSPAVGPDGTIYVGSEDHRLYAVDGPGGAQIWSFKAGGGVGAPAVGFDGTVYVGSYDHKFYALNGKDGTVEWSFQTGGLIIGAPMIASDGTVYVGSGDGILYALSGKTGAMRWSCKVGGSITSQPQLGSDGTVYVGSSNHTVDAVDTTGIEKWSFKIDAPVNPSATLGVDGTVYVGSPDSNVYALDGATGKPKWSLMPSLNPVARHTRINSIASAPVLGPDGSVYVGSAMNTVRSLDSATGAQRWMYRPPPMKRQARLTLSASELFALVNCINQARGLIHDPKSYVNTLIHTPVSQWAQTVFGSPFCSVQPKVRAAV